MEEKFSLIKPYEGSDNYIFISYAHKDSERVFPLLRKLTENGYRIWYDEGIDPGTEWPESIARHLDNCKVCLAFLSNASVASTNCRREINFALSRNKDFLSVALEPVKMSPGMEMQISTYQSLLSYKYPTWEAFEEKLLSLDILKSCQKIIVHEVKEEELPEEKPEPEKKPPVVLISKPAEKEVVLPDVKPEPVKTEKKEKKVREKKEKPVKPQGQGKKPIGKILIGAVLAAVLIGAIVIINPFKKSVKIDDVEYKNQDSISVKEASLSVDEVKGLAGLDECRYLFFTNCSFDAGAIKNLESLKELRSLDLKNCSGVDDLSFLNNMERLYAVTAENCGITDDAVKNLSLPKSVYRLEMPYNKLTFVPKAEGIYTLDLTMNQVSDLENLKNMTALTTVKLGGNKITDISALAGMPKIETLNLNSNQLTSIAALEGFVYLEELYLGYNDISDLSPLVYCTVLEQLNLSENKKIKDVSFIGRNAKTLEALNLSGIKLTDASILNGMSAMKDLYVNRCGLTDLSFVKDMRNLETLNAAGNAFTDVKPLDYCSKLTVINLASNKITSLEGLPKKPADASSSYVAYLFHDNEITSLEGLDSNYNYTYLTLTGNPVENAESLREIKGSYIMTDMIPAYNPEYLKNFYDICVPEENLELKLAWETTLNSRLKYEAFDEALKNRLKEYSIGKKVLLP